MSKLAPPVFPGSSGDLKDVVPSPTPFADPTETRNAPRRPRKVRLVGRLKAFIVAVVVLAVFALAYLGREKLNAGGRTAERPLTATVHRGTLRVVVTERGNLESTVTVDGVCELSGFQNKIIQLLPEGQWVEKGTIVCRFDAAEIDKNVAQQQIKVQQAKSKIETTKQELEIAKNDAASELVKAEGERKVAYLSQELFQEGTNKADVAEAQAKIRLADKEYDKTKTELVVMVTPEITMPLQRSDPKPLPAFPREFMPNETPNTPGAMSKSVAPRKK